MTNLDIAWVKEQLQAAKVKKPVGDAIMRLIDLYGSMEVKDDKARDQILDLFSVLAKGHAVSFPRSEESGVWIEARPGDIKVTDTVRVKLDAFSGPRYVMNGRVGKVVGIRYGDIIFKSTDGKTPVLEGEHFLPAVLEKMVNP